MPTSTREVVAVETKLGHAAVTEWLGEGGWHYQFVAHKPTYRSVAEAAASGVPAAHAVKSLVLRVGEGFHQALGLELAQTRRRLRATEAELQALEARPGEQDR